MSLLYPRLLTGQAKPLFEEYQGLPIAELVDRVRTTHESAVYAATGGDRASTEHLESLRETVLAFAKEAGFPEKTSQKANATFDLHIAEYLHSRAGLMPAEAASGDIWAFIALMVLPDVAFWRYPNPPKDRVLGTDLTRHVFGRMWWRAQLVYTPASSDPYSALSVLGESAFDQIYARRKALGGSPYLVKAILRVWNELDLSTLKGKVSERAALRDFLQRLLRLSPFILFEALEEEQLDAELRTAVRETVTAIAGLSIAPEEISDQLDSVFAEEPTPGPEKSVTGASDWGFPEIDLDAASAANPTRLARYSAYDGPSFGDPRELDIPGCADAIVSIVAVEGPVKTNRAFRVITRLANSRLRSRAKDILLDATRYAVRTGKLIPENQRGPLGYHSATLRTPDQPLSVLRERGPRDLDEIPEGELAAASDLFPDLDFDRCAKQVSALFGYDRTTQLFKEHLHDALKKRDRRSS